MFHQLQDKNRGSRALRDATRKQQEQRGGMAQFIYMSPGWEGVGDSSSEYDDDLDQGLLKFLFAQHPAKGEPPYKRAPAKFLAADPPAGQPHTPVDSC